MFRSGYVSIVGIPNVGKSTLLNQLLGEKLSIVTDKPQTTRHRILGILHRPQSQILFLDTPGIHQAKALLNERIVKAALATIEEADVVCHLVLPKDEISRDDQKIYQRVKGQNKPHLVVLNKVDQVAKESLLPLIAKIQEQWAPQQIVPLSALTGEGCQVLPEMIEKLLSEGPAYFPKDQYTEHDIRFLCEELVREKAMKFLHQEIPYGLTTRVESYNDKGKIVHLHLAIIVERKNHKGMVIGSKGRLIKKIGSFAREDIEKLIGKKVFLELFVKVVEGWSLDERRLSDFGIN